MPAANKDAGLTPTMREWHWVGDINIGARNDGYVGAKCITFRTQRGFNRYFKDGVRQGSDGEEIGMLLIKVLYSKPVLWGLLGTYIIALVTNQLDPKEMMEMDQTSRRIEQEMAEWRKQRDAAEAEDAKVQLRTAEELKRLARLGAECEKNHKANKAGG